MATPYELTKTEFLAERQQLLVFFPIDDAITVNREAVIAEALWQQYSLPAICYAAAEIISERLESGRGHWRDDSGRLLTRLDEVVRWLMEMEAVNASRMAQSH